MGPGTIPLLQTSPRQGLVPSQACPPPSPSSQHGGLPRHWPSGSFPPHALVTCPVLRPVTALTGLAGHGPQHGLHREPPAAASPGSQSRPSPQAGLGTARGRSLGCSACCQGRCEEAHSLPADSKWSGAGLSSGAAEAQCGARGSAGARTDSSQSPQPPCSATHTVTSPEPRSQPAPRRPLLPSLGNSGWLRGRQDSGAGIGGATGPEPLQHLAVSRAVPDADFQKGGSRMCEIQTLSLSFRIWL